MAWDLSKIKFFNRLDARARVFVLVGALFGILLLVYLATRLLSSGDSATGPTRVAAAPPIQSVPGSQLSPEYYRTLTQANQQAAQQAQLSAGSAIPTLINPGGAAGCVICSDENANVKNQLDNWVKQGLVSPDVAATLQNLADKNVPVATYAQELQNLVKEGKLTPQQARQLLDEYRRQHANALLQQSAKALDPLIKSGQLPLDVANQLLDDQRKKMTPAQYAQELQRLVAEGKISPETAQQLLSQYTQQRAKQVTADSIAILEQMIPSGQLTPEVEQALADLETQMVPLDQFTSAVQQFIASGKITPAVATKVIDEYKQQKQEIGPTAGIDQLIQQAEQAAYQEVSDLLKEGKITPDVAATITGMLNRGIPFDEFQNGINQLVQQGKLTPQIATLKIGDYKKITDLKAMAARLAALHANNASPADYAAELKKDVAAGLITPEQAAQLMKEYQALTAPPAPTPVAATGDNSFAQLQQRAQQGLAPTTTAYTPSDFGVAATPTVTQTPENEQSAQDRANQLAALIDAMRSQANQLIDSWAPPKMEQHLGTVLTTTTTTTGVPGAAGATTTTTTTTTTKGAPIVKAGTVAFAVLDTGVNSDYPTTPVMATIVTGPLKGAKLLGQMVITTNNIGQQDRISLNFTLMNKQEWTEPKSITAYAIDPDTARTVFASAVNYHYFLRFGAIMATSFLQGFASAITNSGSTSTTGIFGTSTQHPITSTAQNIWIGLGQVGTTLGSAIQNYINIPPTVIVDPGVSLGILFMADVTA